MQAFAAFIMRGRSQAALVAATSAVLSLLVPLAGILSAATVALVTLRQGSREGLVVGLFAGLASGLLVFLALGSPLPAIGFALALWLPVWILAGMLRVTRRLDLTLQFGALVGLLILVGVHLATDDPAAFWIELLEPLRQGLVDGQVLDEPGSQAMMASIGRWMTGAFAAAFYFQMLLALLLGRWWQGLLYNPGGFGAEYRALRLHPGLGVLGLVLLLALTVGIGGQRVAELLILLTPLYLLQGVAVVHSLVASYKLARGWLIGFYALLVLAMPHAEILVAGLGMADTVMNVRARVGPRDGQGQ